MKEKIKTKEEIEQAEIDFQTFLSLYRETNEPYYRDKIYFSILDCCKNICLKLVKGLNVKDLEEKWEDATMRVFNRVVNHNKNPEKLSSYCYMFCIGSLYGKKYKDWEAGIVQYDDKFENVGFEYDIDDNVMTICKESF